MVYDVTFLFVVQPEVLDARMIQQLNAQLHKYVNIDCTPVGCL
jgi:hypothetical protein